MVNGRKFGVEVELFGISRVDLVANMRAAGFRCEDDGYTHTCTSYWKVVNDGSVSGADATGGYISGCELVSPPLEGEAGLAEVAKVLKLLAKWGARVNYTCGFHVHVEASDLPFGAHRRLVASYLKHEEFFDLLVPEYRRRSSTFCQTLKTQGADAGVSNKAAAAITMAAVNKATCLDDLQKVVNPPTRRMDGELDDAQSGRYRKLNLCAFWRHGTVEFRQQGGSDEHGNKGYLVPAVEWLAWARLCVAMVVKAQQMVEKDGGKRAARNYRLQGNVQELFLAFVGDAKSTNYWRPRLEAALATQAEQLMAHLARWAS